MFHFLHNARRKRSVIIKPPFTTVEPEEWTQIKDTCIDRTDFSDRPRSYSAQWSMLSDSPSPQELMCLELFAS